MKDTIISFTVAKLAKEKGFDEACNDFYNSKGMRFIDGWCEDIYDKFQEPFEISNNALKNAKLSHITAPIQTVLEDWLLKKFREAFLHVLYQELMEAD